MERYGIMTVERYIREGVPEGVMVFFDYQGKATQLEYLRSEGGSLTLHGRRPGSRRKGMVPGFLDTTLYLSQEDITGEPIEDVCAEARAMPRDFNHIDGARPTHSERFSTSPVTAGQYHG